MSVDTEAVLPTKTGDEAAGTATITLDGTTTTVTTMPGETLLESARRAGLAPPYSCEKGNCGSCIATVTDGEVSMRINNTLEPDEVADGLVLTCQGIPETEAVSLTYDD